MDPFPEKMNFDQSINIPIKFDSQMEENGNIKLSKSKIIQQRINVSVIFIKTCIFLQKKTRKHFV